MKFDTVFPYFFSRIKKSSNISTKFPKSGTSAFKINLELKQIKKELQYRNSEQFLGWLYSLPHPLAVSSYSYLLDQNPSHLGTWLHDDSIHHDSTERLEKEVVMNLCDLYRTKGENVEGYVTSGSTEANIFSTWLGRTYLEKYSEKSTTCLLATQLTHYSISKAGRIAGIPQFLVKLDENTWSMSSKALVEKTHELVSQGYRSFLLPLTLGYTISGTSDDLMKLTKTVSEIEKRNRKIHFFIWVDAALNGLTIPFIDRAFAPFSIPQIQAFCVDFHKIGLVPYSAGVIIYRRSLKKLIEKPIDYLPRYDRTLLGSRPGSSSVAVWSMIRHFGKDGYGKIVKESLNTKEYFIKRIKDVDPDVVVVTDKHSVGCGVIFKHRFKNEEEVLKRFGLFAKNLTYRFHPLNNKICKVYKLYFLPGFNKSVVDRFISYVKKEIS